MWIIQVPSRFKAADFLKRSCVIAGFIAVLSACQSDPPSPEHGALSRNTPITAPRTMGGALTAPGPIRLTPQLSPAERLEHSLGASFFHKPWVSAPSTTTDRDGLGPLFNAHSCESCHRKLGRGSVPTRSTRESSGLLFRLYGNGAMGSQLQTRALPGMDAEAQIDIRRENVALVREFSDGLRIELFAPRYTVSEGQFDASLSPRLAPPLIGVGLLNAIADDDLRAYADPDDRNGDGISGRYLLIQQRPGRFGWKGEQADLRTQVAKAFHEDIGISSSVFPLDNPPHCEMPSCVTSDNKKTDIRNAGLDAVTDYLSLLTVPQARLSESAEDVQRGWNLFTRAGCSACHRVNLTTTTHQQALLSEQIIHPFSDLLLHDMGQHLADSADDPLAREWRTAPLWGLGSNGGPYLHDGRANTLLEAVLWHGGEAEAAVQQVLTFNSGERAALLEFLAAL